MGRRFFVLLVLLIGALALPGSASAATFTVTSTTDSDDPDGGSDAFCGTTPATDCSLRAAIETAAGTGTPGDDVVELPFDVAINLGDINVTSGSSKITIRGTKGGGVRSVVDANSTSRILSTNGIPVTLENVTFTEGKPSGAGGFGGAIEFHAPGGQTLRLDNSRIENSKSPFFATSSPGGGGGIYMDGNQPVLELVDSEVDSNQAGDPTHAGDGGGILVHGNAPTVTGTSAEIAQNRAFGASTTRNGGGLMVQNDSASPPSGSVTLNSSAVSGNRVAGGGANGSGIGGGIQLAALSDAPPDLSVTGGTIFGNLAGGGSGNGVGVGGGIAGTSGGTISLTNVQVANNIAGGDDGAPGTGMGTGGGVFSPGQLTVTGGTFSGNKAGVAALNVNGSGGAIRAQGPDTTSISGATFASNQAGSGTGVNGTGGAVDATSDASLTVTNSTFTNNLAASNGGGLFRLRGASAGGDDSVSGTRFAGNSAGVDGGGIHLATNANLTLSGSEVSGNGITSAAGGLGGGGIWAETESGGPGALAISNSTITGNSATLGSQDGGGLMDGVSAQPIDVDISYSTIADNHAADQGGNVWVQGTASVTPTVSFASSIVSAGTAGAASSSNCFFQPLQTSPSSTGGNIEDTTPSQCGLGTGTDLVGTNPLLSALASNGGPTQTMALESGSPALSHGVAPCPATDQRGYPRPGLGGGACDSGAYELSVCDGAPVNQSTPITSCPPPPPPPPTGVGGAPPTVTPSTPKKKCKKKHRRSATAAKKCKKKR